MKNININSIRLDGGTQSRAEIHADTVAEYADALADGTEFPPIVVFYDGVDYWLGDGFHRVHAFRRAGRASISADVRVGTQSDAQLFSYGVNAGHGLRRSNADKRKAVEGALKHAISGEWSDNQIAKHCGVSHPFVGSVRSSLETVSSESSSERTYTTKHGTQATMKTGSIGGKKQEDKKAEPKQAKAEAKVEPTEQTHPEATNDDGPTLAELVDELQAENTRLTAEIKALTETDDQKAETIKWHRMYEHAMRQQADAMRSAASHQKDAKRLANQVRECCRALGLNDPRQLVPTVKKLAARREAA